jgi:uncharacterized protein
MTTDLPATRQRAVVVPERRTAFLANARREAERRGIFGTLVVDVDSHHYEQSVYREVARYIDNPRVKRIFSNYSLGAIQTSILPGNLGDRNVAGRIRSQQVSEWEFPVPPDGVHSVAWTVLEAMHAMGIDYTILFPTPMLVLGTTPESDLEVALARAYNRWLVREVLPHSDAIRTMLYLPLSNPEACVQLIREFGGEPSVVGFMVTALRYQPIWENRFMQVFAALNEVGKPLAFHSAPHWGDRPFEQLNTFLGVHALGFPFYAMIQLTNILLNGIPERFPDLRFVFLEAGIAWLPFLIARMDNEYLMRSSEAPLLTRMPGDYIREFYFSSQPLERIENQDWMRTFLEMTNAENRLLYSSDYPHQDFDLPSAIWDIKCLTDEARRKILGGNAASLFGLPDIKLHERPDSGLRR